METTIRGTTMPVLEIRLTPGESVVAEAGQLGWCDDGIELETSTAMAGADGMFDAALRTLGGSTFFMTRYASTTRPGVVAFPARMPGKIFQLPLGPGRSYVIQRHGFLAGVEGCELSTAFHPGGLGSAALGGFGFLLQKVEGTGHVWVELAGEVVEIDLEPGRELRVHPGHVGVVESGVAYELTTVPGVKNKLFGGDLFLLRLTGPGKVWLQSLSLPLLAHSLEPYLPRTDAQSSGSQSLESIGVGAAIKGLSELL
jgi:uncharacterized protein (TIGR00266 family)